MRTFLSGQMNDSNVAIEARSPLPNAKINVNAITQAFIEVASQLNASIKGKMNLDPTSAPLNGVALPSLRT